MGPRGASGFAYHWLPGRIPAIGGSDHGGDSGSVSRAARHGPGMPSMPHTTKTITQRQSGTVSGAVTPDARGYRRRPISPGLLRANPDRRRAGIAKRSLAP